MKWYDKKIKQPWLTIIYIIALALIALWTYGITRGYFAIWAYCRTYPLFPLVIPSVNITPLLKKGEYQVWYSMCLSSRPV